MELTVAVEPASNKNKGVIMESIEIDDLMARIDPKLLQLIFILMQSNKSDRRSKTDIVREIDSAGDIGPNRADLSLVLFILYREALFIQL